ncbi:hypothetical protein T4D_7991 [Trichinella pseudospiralis]|uniref:Uncharacterized protein n=1 Tax=Trichinella pseudospiralis TaxID=6337 RepID=A0A0V1FKD8_TRIPS|nr:hypothetical protein T4D_7991 [Trichinella pseudospiralis]
MQIFTYKIDENVINLIDFMVQNFFCAVRLHHFQIIRMLKLVSNALSLSYGNQILKPFLKLMHVSLSTASHNEASSVEGVQKDSIIQALRKD